ncbi:MAG: hypothetical protein QF485_09940 [Arenicellales bacterium]|nr:hypothetical protein [Arenicellales bacterium]|tara:strand:+ start:478 stop:1233 length:756 start_codon:yes stop_codon:yes gene_type:complete
MTRHQQLARQSQLEKSQTITTRLNGAKTLRYLLLLAPLLLAACGGGDTSSGLTKSSDSEESASVDTSTSGSNSATSSCYEDYVRDHADLLQTYQASGTTKSIEDWGQAHYENSGKAEGRQLPSSCPGSSTSSSTAPRKRGNCSAGGTPSGSPVGPDLNGSWSGTFTRYTGASGGISATVSHVGSRVEIRTSAGFALVGRISDSGSMRLCDSDRESWTTLYGGATTTSLRLADHYMDGSGVLLGTDVLVLTR